MPAQQFIDSQVGPARGRMCVSPCGEKGPSAAVESLLRDLALALQATRAIRRAMETGQRPALADR